MEPRKVYEQLFYRLCDAQNERNYRPIHSLDEPYWLDYEMLVMYGEVNRLRDAAGKDLIDFQEIKRVEQQASGHVDYTKKFALYCAELVTQ